MPNTGATLLDAAHIEEMIDRLGTYRILDLIQTQLTAKANRLAHLPYMDRLAKVANAVQVCAVQVDRIFHGEV
jgi:hypothetical protein